jgi:tRNA-binding protein
MPQQLTETDAADALVHENTYECFSALDIRAGRVLEVKPFERARVPSYRLTVDFGPEVGVRESSVQARADYTEDQLKDTWVVGVVNLPERNIAGFKSQALILGVQRAGGGLNLVRPDVEPAPGSKLY